MAALTGGGGGGIFDVESEMYQKVKVKVKALTGGGGGGIFDVEGRQEELR